MQTTTDNASIRSSDKQSEEDYLDQEKSGKLAYFAAAWGNGRADTKKGKSREHFEYIAGQAAINDIRQYGELCRTREGDLYFTSTELPWKLVPLVNDDPRLIALIEHVFQVRASSTQAFKVILYSLQNEAFVNGLIIQVRQFCHADHSGKVVYLSLCDGQQMLKLTGTDEETWDRLPIVDNGTDGVYFIDDAAWEAWQPVMTPHYVTDPETEEEIEIYEYDRTIAKRLLIDTIKFKADMLTLEEQRWLMDKVLTTLLIDLPEKPLLALVGDNGSGKTFVGETIKTALLGGRAGRAENINTAESLRVSLTSNPLVIVDNLDDVDKKQAAWLVKDISVACTGTTIPLRRLYTTNQKVVLEPRSWIIATSTNTGFLNNSPALGDRAVVFTLDRMEKGGFKERAELMRPILRNRDAILTDLALRLNDYVVAWRNSTLSSTDFRVASFGLTVSKMAEQDGELEKAKEILTKIVAKQNAVITDNHWLIEAIERFISGGKGEFKVNGEELLVTAQEAGYHSLTVNKIHAEIEALNRVLAARYDVKVTYPGNRKTYTFRKKAADQTGGETQNVAQSAPEKACQPESGTSVQEVG
jgi:ABC-type oligopeptide transport system ATPase subunit